MVQGHRPVDWHPLEGGDPCPGDPEAWTTIVAHWEQRSDDMDRLKRNLEKHVPIDAEGIRFRQLEETFTDGATMLRLAAEEFSRAAETVREWQVALRNMQERADEALIRARQVQGWLEEAQRAEMVNRWWNAQLPPVYDEQGNIIGSTNERKPLLGALSEKQRLALMRFAPGLVGNMQGIEYSYRAEANLNLISVLSSDPEHSRDIPLSLEGLGITQEIRDTAKEAMNQYKALKSENLDPQIITFEVQTSVYDKYHWDDVKAAVSMGNLDTVDNISYLTHGMDANAQKSLGGHIKAAKSLHDQNGEIFDLHGGGSHATVAWLNYTAPEQASKEDLSVLDNQKAYAGGLRYAQDLDTLNTLRGEDNIRLNTVAHSYGTATTFSGMTAMTTQVDSAVFLGSAGLPKEQVEAVNKGELDLAMDPKNLVFTTASEDPLARLGRLKPGEKLSPASLKGAKQISADGGYAQDGHYYQDTDGHDLYTGGNKDGYLDEGTSALYQTSLMITGHEDRLGILLDYVAPGDKAVNPLNGETLWISEDRKDLSSPEDMKRLKMYALSRGIPWDYVQKGESN